MSTETAEWLIGQREQRGWSRPQMARELIKAGQALGDKHLPGTDCLKQNIYRWEHGGGVSHEYVTLYCHVLGIDYREFPRQKSTRPRAKSGTALAVRDHPQVPEHGHMTYGGTEMPALGDLTVEDEVMMAAHEGSEHAESAEQRAIGDATMEQFRSDVMRLSREMMSREPLLLFRDMRRVRRRMQEALDRHVWPRDSAELYFLLGCLNGLMGKSAVDLGYWSAGDELFRAGWAYALVADHRPLMARIQAERSDLAYYQGQYRRATDLASSGLEYLAAGPVGTQLHQRLGRATASLGDTVSARRAVSAAGDAYDPGYRDDLTAIGGQHDLSQASARYLTGSVLLEIPESAAAASAELQEAADLYAAGPGPGETHGYAMVMRCQASLAEARLRGGELEAAAGALDTVLALPGEKRVDPLPQHLGRIRAELAKPAFHGSAQARDLDERIEEFLRESLHADLDVPAIPG